MPQFKTWNGPTPTTAAQAAVTTGTAIKTMLQVSTPASRTISVIAWGFTVDAAPAATGVGVVELLQTDVAATVTAHVAAGVQPIDPNGAASLMTLGVANTGYTGSAEGTTTAARVFDVVNVAGVSNGGTPTTYAYQFLPDERPQVAISKFLRVRVTFSAAVNMRTWILWDE